ncbi:MAG TPA: class I SAM-dependent methyltransferase [Sporichthya sp.]|nr:class I SAM-dependent methyltransferase [Sporichthya sp.]
MESTLTGGPLYAFDGDRAAEDRRLIAQARLFDPITGPQLRAAGLSPGMHVLDLGAGAGDTALLAADLVGPAGSVLGIERSPEAVALARRRVGAAGVRNIRFIQGDVNALDGVLAEHPEIDAVIGRLILMWVPDPAAILRTCAQRLRPDALVCFFECDLDIDFTNPRSPLWDRTQFWVEQGIAAIGAEPRMGTKLHRTFRSAGLPAPHLHQQTVLASGREAPTWLWVNILRGFLPALETNRITTADVVDVDTLEARLTEEIVRTDAVMTLPPVTVAWARVPS